MNKIPQPGSARFSFTRFLPLLLLAAGLVAFFASGLSSYLTLDALKENRETLQALVQAHKAEAVVVFILAYIAVAALKALADDGEVPALSVAEAMKKYGVDGAKPAPWTV